MFNEEEEDDVLAPKEPQVTSQDPEERKAARRLRIKRRQEALKRAEQPEEEQELEQEPGLVEITSASAAEELQRLQLDGATKVTNVKLSTDEREVTRRTNLQNRTASNLQRIEEEAADAQLQYEAITENWKHMLSIKDPLDIDAETKLQKEKCDNLLKQKDELIAELKEDLKRMDQAYFDDLEKQDADIKELSERIEKNISIMHKAYAKQLSLIEQSINIERETMLEHNNKRWEALYKQRDKEEVAHMEDRFEKREECKVEMEEIMWDHHEKYRVAKIELETLIQDLQKELEKLKATCIINAEKIGYTYQILKKREEENVFVRSQQKRKLNKMADIANALRSKIRKASADGNAEELKADAEIKKLMQAMDDIEKKSNQFSHVNHYKFSQVWRMSAARCSELAKDLRLGEVAMHAHILAEPPPPPPPLPHKNPLLKYEHEMATDEQKEDIHKKLACHTKVERDAKEELIRHILQLVADNTGFLVEDRLFRLISKYQQSAQNLCTLDAIFMALEIYSDEDIELLCKTFLNYAFCPLCASIEMDSEDHAQSTELSVSRSHSHHDIRPTNPDPTKSREKVRSRVSVVGRSMSASTSRAHIAFRNTIQAELSQSDAALVNEAEEYIQKCGDSQAGVSGSTPEGSATHLRRSGTRGVTVSLDEPKNATESVPASPYLCPVGHVLEIEPMQVLTALNEFIAGFVPPEKRKLYDILESLEPPTFDTPSRKLTVEEIKQYWSQWKNVFPESKDKFWDGLLTGLKNYSAILQERERIHDQVVQLRKRNVALRRLVRGTLPEIPPPMPQYMKPYPPAFVAAAADHSPLAYARLPPI